MFSYEKINVNDWWVSDNQSLWDLQNSVLYLYVAGGFLIVIWLVLSWTASIIILVTKWRTPKAKRVYIIWGVFSLIFIGAFGAIAFSQIAKTDCLLHPDIYANSAQSNVRPDTVNYDNIKVDTPKDEDIYL